MWRFPIMAAAEDRIDKLSLSTKPSGADDRGQTQGAKSFGADIRTSVSISPGYAHFPRYDMHGDWQLCPRECENKSSGGCTNLNFLNDSRAAESLINVKSNMSEVPRESGMLYPDVSMSEFCHAVDGNNTVTADCLMDAPISSRGYKSEVYMNFMPPRSDIGSSYPIKAHGAEAKMIRTGSSQMNGKFSSSECSTSVLPLVDNFGVTEKDGDINIVPFPFSSPQEVDGKFLTLGIGGATEIKLNSNFSPREIASKLDEPVSSQYNSSLVGQCAKNSLTLTQLAGRDATIQTNSGGFSSLDCNLAGRMSTFDEGRLVGSARLKSRQFPGFQTSQANLQPNILAKYENFVFDPALSSLPFGSTFVSQPECINPIPWPAPSSLPFGSTSDSQPECTPIPLGPEISKSTYFSSQSISQQQVCRKSSMNVSAESSRNYPSDSHIRSSINHAQLGKLIPLTEGRRTKNTAGVHFQPVGNPSSPAEGTRTEVCVQPVGHLHTQNVHSVGAHGNTSFPGRVGFPIPTGGNFQSSPMGLFPKRLGVQANDLATVQTTEDYFQKPVRTPFTVGSPPLSLALQFNPFRPSSSPGQQHCGMPDESSKDFPKVAYSNGPVIPVAKYDVRPLASPIVSHPSSKRRATENSLAIYLGKRRKISPQPVTHHSAPHRRQSFPAPIPATVCIPPAPLHIKWQGFEDPLKPTGHKCHLCKRDLSFTAEGPAHQPANPPAVAVLPCGHTFHDHCLQIITPEDQLKSPPCIPCAIGET